MDNFNIFIQRHFKISFSFFILGLLFGIIYSINLLGYSIESDTLLPSNMRSLHISLMLYGFIPLMLSYLPFLLIKKEIGFSLKGLYYLNLYTIFWYIFLIFLVFSLLFGNTRGLSFYDFPYELNFILAFAGMFYILALYEFIRQYKIKPMWVNVCLKIVMIAPFSLLFLMNPVIGQVENTISGPHGDNTLGMSLSLIPLYYLILKLISDKSFEVKWNILWIIPTIFYIASVLYRSFIGHLTYNEEWFLQYLTLLYIPLLYVWLKESEVKGYAKISIVISIISFLFVDIEGNILFIPEIRWLFHRNDLIVAHAHVAMGIAIFFMVISIFTKYIKELNKKKFYISYLIGIVGIFLVLSISGFVQSGFFTFDIFYLWLLRTLFGIITISSLFYIISFNKKLDLLQKYNLFGLLSDGLGGFFLILFASYLYPLIGFEFNGKYEYVVFAFVCSTGILHFVALIFENYSIVFSNVIIVIRIFISAVFFSLYYSGILGVEALLISIFDFLFSLLYLLFIYDKEILCKE
jgi:hypothetical protein